VNIDNFPHSQPDVKFMKLALKQATIAYYNSEVPIGALLVDANGRIIAQAYNQVASKNDLCGHAEMLVLRQASARIQHYRMLGYKLYTTLEPCLMCFGAIVHSRIKFLYFAAPCTIHGAFSKYSIKKPRKLNISYGLLENESVVLLKNFFLGKRDIN
jgi:tRNA(adenine34) deaminase